MFDLLLVLFFGLGFAAALFLDILKPNTKDELMAAIDDVKSAVTRLESARDKVVANVPVDLTPDLRAVKDRVDAVSASLEATLPPTP